MVLTVADSDDSLESLVVSEVTDKLNPLLVAFELISRVSTLVVLHAVELI